MALLEISNLTKRFGGLVANNAVGMEVNQGEIVGLIGPNGAGKTTLFNCISGFYSSDGGSVVFEGQDITRFSADRVCREGMARTFQIVKIFKDMTVLENVMVGAFCRTTNPERARQEALKTLELVGLVEKKDVPSGSLTIAEQKRLELTRALATQPRLLMLDETMAGLNPMETRQAVELLRKINAQGVTLIVVEHVMEAIMTISDRITVLDYGKKIAEDVPENIAQNEEVIKAYLGERYYARS
ncbi:MAG: ABC transporter ATP-binding protein [Anaerolineales bacterium]|nr:MAG: ABC transporter ATP-binding protein [Anaerolineales bacterium]